MEKVLPKLILYSQVWNKPIRQKSYEHPNFINLNKYNGLTFEFETEKFIVHYQDLKKIIDDLKSTVKEGHFAIVKKMLLAPVNLNQEEREKEENKKLFMIKIMNILRGNDGSYNDIEVRILQSLSKLRQAAGPYITHFTICKHDNRFADGDGALIGIIMKSYTCDLEEIQQYWQKADIWGETNDSTEIQISDKNRFYNLKYDFFKDFLVQEEDRKDNRKLYVHTSLLELLTIKIITALISLKKDIGNFCGINQFQLSHGDIKPGNLLYNVVDGCLDLTDYGTAGPEGCRAAFTTNYHDRSEIDAKHESSSESEEDTGEDDISYQSIKFSDDEDDEIEDKENNYKHTPTYYVLDKRKDGPAKDLYSFAMVISEFILLSPIIVFDSNNFIKDNCKIFTDILMDDEKAHRLDFYRNKCPELLNFVEICLGSNQQQRVSRYNDFVESDYFENLLKRKNEIEFNVKLYFATIPDRKENKEIKKENTGLAEIDDPYHSWCDQVLRLKFPQMNGVYEESQRKWLEDYYDKEVEPYFGEGFHHRELKKFLFENYFKNEFAGWMYVLANDRAGALALEVPKYEFPSFEL